MASEQRSEVWEVYRDRLGVMFSEPLEVGECIRVVSEAQNERLRSAANEALLWSNALIECITEDNPVSRRQAFFDAQDALTALKHALSGEETCS